MLSRIFPVAAAVALLAVSGVVHGLWTNRWHTPRALKEAIARVDRVPLTVGGWKGETLGAPDVDPAAFARAGAQGYWMRRYVKPGEGTPVTAILMCGHGSQIAVHPPEVCYRAAGFELVAPPVPYLVKAAQGAPGPAEFRTALFATSGHAGGGKQLRLFWSWSATGEWHAPSGDARWTFSGAPFLYKLYVVHEVTGFGGTPDRDPGVALLTALVPELQRTLFSPQEQ